MTNYSPVWPHGNITKVFTDVYVVRGSNVTYFEEKKIQHSRNMTILTANGELTLINTVRLDEKGLEQLEQLGVVKYVINIGAFHGRDDAFYLDRYQAVFLTVNAEKKDKDSNNNTLNLKNSDKLSIQNASFFMFHNSFPNEGFIYIKNHGGIIITCDSVKNWIEVDEFFSKRTGKSAMLSGEIGTARISPIWLKATGVQKSGFDYLLTLKFNHLISAHGEVLKNIAYDSIKNSVEQIC